MSKNIVKFTRLLYVGNNVYRYVIEFEVNGELKLWYNINGYQGWNKPSFFNGELSDQCILQNQTNLAFLFLNSQITHFDINLPNVENTSYMFSKCKDLIYFKSKMSNVQNIDYMFHECSEEFFQNHPHLRDL